MEWSVYPGAAVIFLPRWFLLMGCCALLMAAGTWHPALGVLSVLLGAGVLGASVWEVATLPGREAFHVHRSAPDNVEVDTDHLMVVEVRNATNRPWTVLLRDEPSATVEHAWSDVLLWLNPLEAQRLEYPFRARSRGDHVWQRTWMRVRGRLGLVGRVFCYDTPHRVRAYLTLPFRGVQTPTLHQIRRARIGGRIVPVGGTGREFESLRDYVPDDEFRRIDWKATARRGRLISREYQIERSQNVILVLDMGRTMLANIGRRPKIEHAIVAALGLAQAASLCDDKVGVCLFDDRIRSWLSPRRGRRHLYAVMNSLHEATARRVEADYRVAADMLQERCRTRSLMVVFTDVWDPDSSATLRVQLDRMRRHHVVLCVTMADSNVLAKASAVPTSPADAYAMGVATAMLEERAAAIGLLQGAGVGVVDAPADRLSAELVNRYLNLKRRMVL